MSLERPWFVFVFWAALLGISLTVLWAVIGLGPIKGWISVASFLAAISTTLVMAGLAGAGAWRRRALAADGPEALPDFSFPTVLAAIALAAMALGLELGPWLVLIGAGLLAFALGGLVSEQRATRQAASRAIADEV